MEQALMEFGLKDGIFVALFLWLFIKTMKQSEKREEKLYSFLESMREEFSKLVKSYEKLSYDVAEIREEIERGNSDGTNSIKKD
jgi:hypothetical protein